MQDFPTISIKYEIFAWSDGVQEFSSRTGGTETEEQGFRVPVITAGVICTRRRFYERGRIIKRRCSK